MFSGSNNKGFTLVELLIALTIFSVGLLALASMQMTSIRGNSTAYGITAMTSLADGLLEELLSRSGDDPILHNAVVNKSWPKDFATDPEAKEWNVAGTGTLSAQYSISPDTPFAGLTQIDISVDSGFRQINKTTLKRTY